MQYDYVAIPQAEVPRAVDPPFQHLLDTYAGETDKVTSIWRSFSEADFGFRPHQKALTVLETDQTWEGADPTSSVEAAGRK